MTGGQLVGKIKKKKSKNTCDNTRLVASVSARLLVKTKNVQKPIQLQRIIIIVRVFPLCSGWPEKTRFHLADDCRK